MGLTPDAVKNTPAWQIAKRSFKGRFVKRFAVKLKAERDAPGRAGAQGAAIIGP